MIVALMNERTRQPVATSVEIAATRSSRRRGLLGRDRLAKPPPCCWRRARQSCRYALRDRRRLRRPAKCAVKVVRDLRPWRVALAAGARVIGMPAGSLRWGAVLPGDRLCSRRRLRPTRIRRSEWLRFFSLR
jgi:uncharacterized membrane protein (UPF0127 family)